MANGNTEVGEWMKTRARLGGPIIRKPEPLSGEQVKAVRYILGFTQQELALSLGMHASAISRWEAKDSPAPPHIRLAMRWLVRERTGQDPTF